MPKKAEIGNFVRRASGIPPRSVANWVGAAEPEPRPEAFANVHDLSSRRAALVRRERSQADSGGSVALPCLGTLKTSAIRARDFSHMKVICDRSALVEALNIVGGVVAARTPSPLLKCVKLAAAGGSLTLAATDLEVGLRLAVEQVDIQKPGDAVVPADKLIQIVRASEDPTLTIETDNHAVHIRGADSHFTVFGYDPKEFPAVREAGDSQLDSEIDGGSLQRLVARTLFAAASEHSRYAINGVLFERQGKKLRLVATDGRRLAVARGECRSASGEMHCIVPTKALRLLIKLINDPEAAVRVVADEHQVVFTVGDDAAAAVLSTNLVEGAFPPFEDVIPKDQV
jgi:DNA polymerase-3 subunit beta